jgi:hypothetical protein
VTHEYFDERMVNRQRLLWTIATRRQLERWEPYVAASVLRSMEGGDLDSADIWSAEIEHHFALVAARHLLRALELEPATRVSIDPTLRAELIQGRDLHEHWPENLPVFNVSPRVEEPPRATGGCLARTAAGVGGGWPAARLRPSRRRPGPGSGERRVHPVDRRSSWPSPPGSLLYTARRTGSRRVRASPS